MHRHGHGTAPDRPALKVSLRTVVCGCPPRRLHLLRLRAIALALRAKVASRHFLDVASTPPHEEGNAPNRHIVNSFTRLPARHKLPARRAGIGTLARGLVGIERHSCRIGWPIRQNCPFRCDGDTEVIWLWRS